MTSPALALDGGKHIGRVYRRPGTPLPDRVQYDDHGQPFLRHRDAAAAIREGVLIPSITNVLDVQNAPHLLGWTAKKTATAAVEVAAQWPDLLVQKPSEAISYLKGAADRDRDEAAERGSRVHDACEALALGRECPPRSEHEMKYVDAWKAFCDRWQPEFLHTEITVFGQTPSGLPYAGTGDLVFRANGLTILGDYKATRSGLHVPVAMQTSALAHADHMTPDNETLVPMIPVDAGVAIHLDPEGYQVKPVVLGGQTWRTFCGLREAWDFHVLEGDLLDGRKALGQALRGPEAVLVEQWRDQAPSLSAATT